MSTNDQTQLAEAIRWALATSTDPAFASADWIAADIDSSHPTVESLLTDPDVDLVLLRQAKSAFKTMRLVGETSADRRLGARLYAAAIAAGLVWHERRISRQSEGALRRAFTGLLDDEAMPRKMRDLAGRALNLLNERGPVAEANGDVSRPDDHTPPARSASS